MKGKRSNESRFSSPVSPRSWPSRMRAAVDRGDAHAVADEQDHVLGVRRRRGAAARFTAPRGRLEPRICGRRRPRARRAASDRERADARRRDALSSRCLLLLGQDRARRASRSMFPPVSTTPTRLPATRSRSRRQAASAAAPAPSATLWVSLKQRADRRADLGLRDRDDPLDAGADQRERVGVRHAHREAVGERVGGVGRDRPPGRERERVGRRALRDHADDARARAERVARARSRADPRAEPDRHVQELEIRLGAKQLERARSPRRARAPGGKTARSARPLARPPASGRARTRPGSRVRARAASRRARASPRSCRRCCRAARRSSPEARRRLRRERARSGRGCRAWPRSRRARPGSRARSSRMYTSPPRSLNDPVGRWFSCFTRASRAGAAREQRPGELRRRRQHLVDERRVGLERRAQGLSSASNFPTRRSCRPPSKGVSSQMLHPGDQLVGRELARAEAQHVRVVVRARHRGGARAVDQRGAHARECGSRSSPCRCRWCRHRIARSALPSPTARAAGIA